MFRNLRIQNKLLLGFFSIIAVIGVFWIAFFYERNEIDRASEYRDLLNTPAILTLQEVESRFIVMQNLIRDFAELKEADIRARYLETRTDLKALLLAYNGLALAVNGDGKFLALEQVRQNMQTFALKMGESLERSDVLASQLFTLHENEGSREDILLRTLALRTETNVFENILENAKTQERTIADRESRVIQQVGAQTRRTLLLLTLLAVLIAFVVAYFLSRSLSRPLIELTEAALDFAEGNLDKRIEVKSHDEIGELGTIFNQMAASRKELEEAKNVFLSVAAHQLRTPLGSMRWNMEMLLEEGEKLPKHVLYGIHEIYESNKRMITLVNDLLNVSRIEQGRVMEEPVPTDIAPIIRDVLKEQAVDAEQKNVSVRFSEQPKVPPLVVDPKKFREIIQNLVSNAIKYNRKNGNVTISVESKIKNQESWVVIAVADSGMGIPKKDQERMFTKFFRASNAVASSAEGTGLGLFVVKYFVERWGGKVKFTSEEGKGTTFAVELPVTNNQ